jgi:hypothetical protein
MPWGEGLTLSRGEAKDRNDLLQGNVFLQRDLNFKLSYCFFGYLGEHNLIVRYFPFD